MSVNSHALGGDLMASRPPARSPRRRVAGVRSLLFAISVTRATCTYDFDVFVIGGGSGGLACAKEAASLGATVGICDFVRASPRGSTWGLGGTCVNVGCIPKKLMHHAGQLRDVLELDAPAYGYDLDGSKDAIQHDWPTLVGAVQNHVRSLNFGHRSDLMKKGVKYFNAKGALGGGHDVRLVNDKGVEKVVSARHIVLATGGRPYVPESFEGAAELAITSDDLFGLREAPGKTLVVGGGYVALECAGLLAGLGHDVSLLVRSVPLRGFDAQCAELVLGSVGAAGAKVVRGATPVRATRADSGRLAVTWTQPREGGSGRRAAEEVSDEFDTILVATGRVPETAELNLGAVGLAPREKDGKIETAHETTAVPHVHAIGDLASEAPDGRPELTPVAIKAGVVLARRLCGVESAAVSAERAGLSPADTPTAVFTPLEYACVGMSEEDARAALGDERLEVYHLEYVPLEWEVVARRKDGHGGRCLVKLLCDRDADERIVGMHLVGDHAAEVMQGFALALRLGATKADVDATIGIHPCVAENVVGVKVTKRSGEDPAKTAC